ncbi:MAG: signal peptidase I [Solirubrobacteraceae bacterium]|nr:signal peptidase I [Solirubrobacteraceae bacterium]
MSRGGSQGSSRGSSLLELVVIVAVALGLALGIQAFLVKPYRIPSESMVPTLEVGERVLVNRIGSRFGSPAVGDVVVFNPPIGAESGEGTQCGERPERGAACDRPTDRKAKVTFIKRVVGAPGDTIAIRAGRVIRNGRPAREPFISDTCGGQVGAGCDFPRPITVPPGHYFMMGDNRGASDDSRFWGPVPESWIIGNAFASYWPPDRIGPL